MKWVKVFLVFFILHVVVWIVTHAYWSRNPSTVLIVADTSFSLKPNFIAMQQWIENYAEEARYSNIVVGTDKALLGDFNDLRSTDVIFRTSFGRSTSSSLDRYSTLDVDKRIFLSDGSFQVDGWQVIDFQ